MINDIQIIILDFGLKLSTEIQNLKSSLKDHKNLIKNVIHMIPQDIAQLSLPFEIRSPSPTTRIFPLETRCLHRPKTRSFVFYIVNELNFFLMMTV